MRLDAATLWACRLQTVWMPPKLHYAFFCLVQINLQGWAEVELHRVLLFVCIPCLQFFVTHILTFRSIPRQTTHDDERLGLNPR